MIKAQYTSVTTAFILQVRKLRDSQVKLLRLVSGKVRLNFKAVGRGNRLYI